MTLVITDYANTPLKAKGACIALGNFDGVHAGHKAVIETAAAKAATISAPLGVLIFEPPPRRYFQPDSEPFRIMRPETRRKQLAELGAAVIFELPFNKAMASMSPEAFVRDVLVEGLGLKHLSVGFDFRFGKGREGDTGTLERLSEQYGFSLSVMPRVSDGDLKVSSTAIRNALQDGRLELANQLLGHYWFVDAVVEHGEKRGRTIGFPTANMQLGDLIHPRHGIYSVWARVEGEADWRPGVANFGRTPTTGERDALLEVFIFDFDGDLYGKTLEVAFVSFLRSEKKFDSLDALVVQMHQDSADAKERLAQSDKPDF